MVVEAHVLGLRIIPQRGRLLIQGLLLPRYFPSDEASKRSCSHFYGKDRSLNFYSASNCTAPRLVKASAYSAHGLPIN